MSIQRYDPDVSITTQRDGEYVRYDDHLAEMQSLRQALVKACRLAGGACSDDVSNEFLLAVPDEIQAKLSAAERREGELETAKDAIINAMHYLRSERADRNALMTAEIEAAYRALTSADRRGEAGNG